MIPTITPITMPAIAPLDRPLLADVTARVAVLEGAAVAAAVAAVWNGSVVVGVTTAVIVVTPVPEVGRSGAEYCVVVTGGTVMAR